MQGQTREGSQTGFLREPGEQREDSSSLEGEQSPWKYRVWARWQRRLTLRTRRWRNALKSIGAPTRTAQVSAWSAGGYGALAAGPNATRTHSRVCTGRKAPMQCRRQQPGNRKQTPGPDRIPVCSSVLDGQMNFGTSGCGELALRAGQLLAAIGRATGWGLRGTAQRHRGNSVVSAPGAGGTTPVVARINPL